MGEKYKEHNNENNKINYKKLIRNFYVLNHINEKDFARMLKGKKLVEIISCNNNFCLKMIK